MPCLNRFQPVLSSKYSVFCFAFSGQSKAPEVGRCAEHLGDRIPEGRHRIFERFFCRGYDQRRRRYGLPGHQGRSHTRKSIFHSIASYHLIYYSVDVEVFFFDSTFLDTFQAYVEFVKCMGGAWLERNIQELLAHLFTLASNPRASTFHVDAVYVRKCVIFMLRSLIGGLLGERAQITAAKEVYQVIVKQMNALGTSTFHQDNLGPACVPCR